MTAATDGRATIHTVSGGGGLRLHVREWGKPDGPAILFIHGWSQNHLCWAKQYESTLADEFRLVAYDLRGHGMSEAPLEPEHYTDGTLWADDVAAIIDQLRLDRPVLVGWSYGAFVICDYLRAHGQDRVAAIDFVEGGVKLGEAAFGSLIGPGFLDHFADATADDLPTNIQAMRSFVQGMPRASRCPPTSSRRASAGTWRCRPRSAPTSRPARSTATTCCARSRCRCWSHRAGPTRWCCRRRPSTSSPPARPPSASWYDGRRTHAAPGRTRALQPRAGRADPARRRRLLRRPSRTELGSKEVHDDERTHDNSPILDDAALDNAGRGSGVPCLSPAVGASPAAAERQLPGPDRPARTGSSRRASSARAARRSSSVPCWTGRSGGAIFEPGRGRCSRPARRGARPPASPTRPAATGSGSQASGRRSSGAVTCACTTHRAGRCSRRISRPEWGC